MKSENFTLKNFIQLENGMYFLHASFSMKDRLFSLVLNDSKEGIHVLQTGKEQYECFCYTKLDEKEICLKAVVDNQKSILLEDEITVLLDASSIASNITFVSSNNGITEVRGWAFTSNLEFPEIQVKNITDNKTSEFSLRNTKFQELIDDSILSKDQMYGFALSFIKEEGKDYSIELRNGNNTKSLPLTSFFSERNETKKLSIGTALKRISPKMMKRFFEYLKENGIKETVYKILFGMQEEFDYDAWFRRNRILDEELERQKKIVFPYAPKISILVPTFNTPKDLLIEMIESVRNQSYANWQLCIADGSNQEETKNILKEYVSKDNRIVVSWLDKNYGISENTNKALELADGEYTALFDHDDVLELNALYEVVSSLQKVHHDIVYTDEDKLNGKTLQYEDPNFKSDYNEDLLLSHNYITHFFVVKTNILREVGGFNSEYDGAQDYDVILKCVEKTNDIHHIAKILYHWRMHEGSTALNPESKMYCYIAGEKAIQHHLDRIGVKAKVEMRKKPYWGLYHVGYLLDEDPLVSIVIPNYEHEDVLKTCIDSLYNVNTYKNFEIIIVENNSKKKSTFDYYEQVQAEHENVKVVTWEGTEFNFSAINNFGAKYAKGQYLLFLNNDTKVIAPEAIREMVGTCSRKNVGIVGAKLLYQDNTIQHAGVVIGFMGYARHIMNDIEGLKDPGYMMRAQVNCDYSAVTAACMMTKKSLFEELDGFDESFKVACNDIDYCLRVRKKNYLVVFNSFAKFYHFESKSRGYENNLEKVNRFNREVEIWQDRWRDILVNGDPYYNVNFKIENEPFELK